MLISYHLGCKIMNNFLYYDTPVDQLQTYYPNIQLPFKAGEMLTQLPKNIAVIRAVAAAAFTGIIALKLSTTVFCWPVAIAGIAFAGWTVYSHLCSKDALLEVFYKISGGKDRFEQLPEIQLGQNPNGKLSEAIRGLNWNQLEHKIAKAKTLDGRNVVIVKGLTRNQTKGVLAFVERMGPNDVPRVISNFHELAESIAHAILFPLTGNTFSRWLYSSNFSISNNYNSSYCKMYSSISDNMANEFFAQMN